MKVLYRYVFRGLGFVLVLAMITILWTACSQADRRIEENRAREAKAADEAKKMLDAMLKDPDKEIRKYTEGRTKPAPPRKQEKSQ